LKQHYFSFKPKLAPRQNLILPTRKKFDLRVTLLAQAIQYGIKKATLPEARAIASSAN
jgi:hypothetical protein